jgi:two-component system, chemotaxis family, CheB/CheR fusion protein
LQECLFSCGTADGGIVEWNRGCEELYGYTREEAIGKRKEELLKTEVPGSSFEEVTNKLREEGVWTGKLFHRAKGGRVVATEALIQVESVGGRRLALQSMRDIADRKL